MSQKHETHARTRSKQNKHTHTGKHFVEQTNESYFACSPLARGRLCLEAEVIVVVVAMDAECPMPGVARMAAVLSLLLLLVSSEPVPVSGAAGGGGGGGASDCGESLMIAVELVGVVEVVISMEAFPVSLLLLMLVPVPSTRISVGLPSESTLTFLVR